MLLESALFLHPNIASALVGQIAQSITSIAKREGKAFKDLTKQTFGADDEEEMLPNEVEGNGDDYDPWACEDTSDCPSEPFEYECVNERCSPVLPELAVDDATMRNVMSQQYGCWMELGTASYCRSLYPKIWPRLAYPEYSYTVGTGETERTLTARNGKPNGDIIRSSLNTIPASGKQTNSVLNPIRARGGIKNVPWFGRVVLDTLPFTAERTEDSSDWQYWLGGPLVWTGFVSNGLKVSYSFEKILTGQNYDSPPHQNLNRVPSATPQDERDGFWGMKPIQENYNLSRNSNDYGWGEWITGDWYNECAGTIVGNSKRVVCRTIDRRCFFRVRYKATIVPSPTDTRFISANEGQLSGAVYGLNASANGVQPHTLKLEVQGQDTTSGWFRSFAPAGGDEYLIKIYRYGVPVETRTIVADGRGVALLSYPFPQEGLYQFTVDHTLSGNGCIVNQPNVNDEFFQAVSPYHINFGLFVNPPPPKRGCTKEGDINYDPEAIIDDGSCSDFDFDIGGGNGENELQGKGDLGGVANRFVDKPFEPSKGIAIAALGFLGVVAIASFGSKGSDE